MKTSRKAAAARGDRRSQAIVIRSVLRWQFPAGRYCEWGASGPTATCFAVWRGISRPNWGRSVCLRAIRSEEHTSELQSLMRISYAVFCLKKKKTLIQHHLNIHNYDVVQHILIQRYTETVHNVTPT